ncbi:MAG: prepilin-type N-terminal cleavage/methylation domain-containing protein [Myxococcota bacterium]|nr:prepilin-type N-terminal cleavage/methylation domain-containing protein [Myxococcota bacterium]
MAANPRAKRGFTLIELMIVLAIIGLLAAIAIPSFARHQLTSKRSEAYVNLSALAMAQKSFHAEYGAYIGVPLAEPGNTQGSLPGGQKRSVAELSAAFGPVGWTPEGDVFYDYDAVSTGVFNGAGADHPGCACSSCLTISAYGDLDADGSQSMVVYFQPDELGNVCNTGLFNQPPPVDLNGDPIHASVVAYPPAPGVADDF